VPRRRRSDSSHNQGLGLQDLLSNALGAVIVLTLIAAAITGTGRTFLRTPERVRQTPEEADIVEWRPPEPIPEERPSDTVLVEIDLALDAPEEQPLLRAESASGTERHPSRLFSPGARQAYALLLPMEDGASWSIGLSAPERVTRMALRVHAGASLLRESDWSRPVPSCPGATTVLSLCRPGADAPIRTSLVMSCERPRRCE